jgi:dethiobiotin synthetase
VTALLVTGTGTGVGKTVVTAAIAALAVDRGERVTVLKPAQTGEPDGGAGDAAEVTRLAGDVRTVELVRYPDPLSPEAAARRSGRKPLSCKEIADAVRAAAEVSDLVLVEGAGGLLVRYAPDGLTIADVAAELDLPVVLVTAAGLGTLNATALTLEAMDRRGLQLHSVVVGAWPADAGLAEHCNLEDLVTVAGAELGGVLPDGAGSFAPQAFLELARTALGPKLGGSWQP